MCTVAALRGMQGKAPDSHHSSHAVLLAVRVSQGQAPRFHVRCLYCRALIIGYPEQRFCKECGWQARYMPLF